MSKCNERWGLPSNAPFYTVPEGVMRFLAENTTPLEERIMHRILAAWNWKTSSDKRVSMSMIAAECSSTRRSVKRALHDLADRGLIDYWEEGQGSHPTLSIRPLITRVASTQRVAKGHKLSKRRLVSSSDKSHKGASGVRLVAKGHKKMARKDTSQAPSTCALPASGVTHPDRNYQILPEARGSVSGGLEPTDPRAGKAGLA